MLANLAVQSDGAIDVAGGLEGLGRRGADR